MLVAALLLAPDAGAQTLTRGPFVQNPDALTTTMTLSWWTDVAGDSTVEYGTTPALGSSVTVPTAGACELGASVAPNGTCHTVPLTGLLPGTRYYYRLLTNGVVVGSGDYFQTFRTPADPGDVFFTVIGDFGQNSSGEKDVANNQNAADPPLVMTVGDNAYQNGTQSDWDNNALVAEYESTLLRRAAFFPVLGNHDLNNVGASNWQNSVEIRMFQLPRNAPAGQEERFFSFDYGDAHFIGLDANPPAITATQTNWLAADLAATTRKWKFVFLHQTPYSCATGLASIGSDMNVRNTWGPLFEQYQVDIVFTGHDHIYERSKILDEYVVGGGPGSDGLKTRYVMTGGGGATLDGACNSDAGGPYRQPIFQPKIYCPWLENTCGNGQAGQYCSFSRFSHVEVRITGNDTATIRGIDRDNVEFDTVVINKSSVCGNGTTESGEDCDQGAANGTSGSCCTAACVFVAAGTGCRSSAGVCDVAESCTGSNGTCPNDGFVGAGTPCRAAAGACDLAESCTGSSPACPADQKSTAPCRASAGPCDVAESCDGVGNDCPADGFASAATGCRASAGVCDPAESCSGSSAACPADQKSTAPCRASAGPCDVAESCDGVGNDCPADQLVPGGTSCRGVAGLCDVEEFCTGGSAACPADGFLGAGTTCRGAAGLCDVAEACTGGSAACPADVLVASGTTCRPSAGVCDPMETCTGSSASCPTDAKSTAPCRSATTPCDVAESCDGVSNDCPPDGFASSATVCRSAAGLCDVPENCTGTGPSCPANGLASSGTVCRPSASPCDVIEACNGSSAACPADAFASSGTVCRGAAGPCDVTETCSGTSGTCPADAKSTAPCRAAVDLCDVPESCDGVSNTCPADAFAGTATVCRGAVGVCDAPESCTGSSATCPPDVKSIAACRPVAGACDVAESCDGVSDACPADQFLGVGVECRAAAGSCDVVEVCTGSSASCPADVGGADADADGVCDDEDICPTAPDPGQQDGDDDGLGDACDPCTNGVAAVNPKLTITKLLTGPSDDSMTVKGEITLPFPFTPAFYPPGVGARVVVVDAQGTTVFDVQVPGGFYTGTSGWKLSGSATWTYKNKTGFQGITRVVLKHVTSLPGLIRFTVVAKFGSWVVTPATVPFRATVVVDAPTAETGQCGEVQFPGLPEPSCAFNVSGSKLTCK